MCLVERVVERCLVWHGLVGLDSHDVCHGSSLKPPFFSNIYLSHSSFRILFHTSHCNVLFLIFENMSQNSCCVNFLLYNLQIYLPHLHKLSIILNLYEKGETINSIGTTVHYFPPAPTIFFTSPTLLHIFILSTYILHYLGQSLNIKFWLEETDMCFVS